MSADKKDYEALCKEFGVTDFRFMLKKLNEMKKEREEAQAEVRHECVTLNRSHAADDSCVASFENVADHY